MILAKIALISAPAIYLLLLRSLSSRNDGVDLGEAETLALLGLMWLSGATAGSLL